MSGISIRWVSIPLLLLAISFGAVHAPPASAATPLFKEEPCGDLVFIPAEFDASRVRCGTVAVNENRSRSDSRIIDITVSVVRASVSPAKPDPVVFLTGGPGQDAVVGTLGERSWYSDAVEDRDFVTFDPRGTGQSGKLACPEFDRVGPDTLKEGLTPAESQARSDAATNACRDRYLAAGVDLTQYDSATIVKDMIEIMAALGYQNWNLIGGSYGTRVGFTALRDAPTHIRSAVLDAPAPPVLNVDIERARTFEPKLKKLWAACAANAKCGKAYPNIENTFWDLVARADANPIAVTVTASDGTPFTLKLAGTDLVSGVFNAMSDTSLLPVLPFAIDDIARGNTGVLSQLASALVLQDNGIASGMFLSVECNEEWPFYTAQAVREITAGVRPEILKANVQGSWTIEGAASLQTFCKSWNAPHPLARENASVTSSVPTLLLAGEFDVSTPTEFSRVAAQTLSNSYVIDVPSSGHFVTFPRRDCMNGFIAAFIAAPAKRPDDACIRAIPPIDFVVAEAQPPATVSPPSPPAVQPQPAPAGIIIAPNTGSGPGHRGGHARGWIVAIAGLGVVMVAAGRRRRQLM